MHNSIARSFDSLKNRFVLIKESVMSSLENINNWIHGIDRHHKAKAGAKKSNESPYWKQLTGMEKKKFLHALRKERDQMLTLGSFGLPTLTQLNFKNMKENTSEKGVRMRGRFYWSDFLSFKALQDLNQVMV